MNHCQKCGGSPSHKLIIDYANGTVPLPPMDLSFCFCHFSSPSLNHSMIRFILEFEELCEVDEIWYPARQEGCISSDGDVFAFDYKLPLPSNALEQESRHEHFSSYPKMLTLYNRRPFIRNITVTWIDSLS